MKKIIFYIFFILFTVIILALTLRGNLGNPDIIEMNSVEWKGEGPFELSPERGRMALTYSLVENNSFIFDLDIAKFVAPDVAQREDGEYVSLFAPGVSFSAIPGYMIGKYFGASQVGAFATSAFFALFNFILIYLIAKKLGASKASSSIASLTYIFASPAFAYAVNLYQHHISAFLMLASIYTLIRWKNIWSLAIVWFLLAASIVIDYPNAILFAPIALFALLRVFDFKKTAENIAVKLKYLGIITLFTALIPLGFFMWSNFESYNNPLQLAGTLKSVKIVQDESLLTDRERVQQVITPDKDFVGSNKTATGFFKTRNMLDGFYIHILSSERGILWFTPIMFLGIFGVYILYRKEPEITAMLVGVIGANLLLYSMWGDPWGGWAFGSRYLIPMYALTAIFIGILLTRLRRNSLFLALFFLLFSYSVIVNTLGAITTSTVPPKVEAVALEKLSGVEEKYSYNRNIDYLKSNQSKSFVWRTFAEEKIPATIYYWIVVMSILAFTLPLVIYLRVVEGKDK